MLPTSPALLPAKDFAFAFLIFLRKVALKRLLRGVSQLKKKTAQNAKGGMEQDK